MLNQQAPERRICKGSGRDIVVHSVFATIQGEGPFCGTPAVFIRLAGCNLACPGCDTDYTSTRARYTVNQLVFYVNRIKSTRNPGLVVITGGEPFRQPLTELINELLDARFYVQIETNGTLQAATNVTYNHRCDDREGCYIVCSPKTGNVHPSIRANACAVKYVMNADSVDLEDGLPFLALGHPAYPKLARMFGLLTYLQPMDSQDAVENNRNREVCVASCLKHGYILQLQVHKLLGME